MCGTSNERHLVSSPGEHGTVKAPYGACTDNGNVVKGGAVQDVPLVVEKEKLISIFEVRAVQRVSHGCSSWRGIRLIIYALSYDSKFQIYPESVVSG
jgi:hypothetical protein